MPVPGTPASCLHDSDFHPKRPCHGRHRGARHCALIERLALERSAVGPVPLYGTARHGGRRFGIVGHDFRQVDFVGQGGAHHLDKAQGRTAVCMVLTPLSNLFHLPPASDTCVCCGYRSGLSKAARALIADPIVRRSCIGWASQGGFAVVIESVIQIRDAGLIVARSNACKQTNLPLASTRAINYVLADHMRVRGG